MGMGRPLCMVYEWARNLPVSSLGINSLSLFFPPLRTTVRHRNHKLRLSTSLQTVNTKFSGNGIVLYCHVFFVIAVDLFGSS